MHSSTNTHTSSYWFIFKDDKLLLLKNDGGFDIPDETSLAKIKPSLQRQHQLGRYNDALCYCAEVNNEFTPDSRFEFLSLRKAFELIDINWYKPAAKAYSILTWDKNHQYCGHCGHQTTHKAGQFERICPACGLIFYPRISPTIIVLISKGNQVLMARSPHFPAGRYALIAGFVEAGESIEDAIHREVKEEVNIEIKNLHYFGSQPWPFPDSLMIGFTADYASGEISIDHKEIEAAGWYTIDNLPGRPSSSVSIAKKLLDAFIAEQKSLKDKDDGNI